jgi:hypothetical protein
MYLTKIVLHRTYQVETHSQTLGVPYGDTFTVKTRYCISWVSPKSCQLLITSGIEWHKSPLVKGIIQSSVQKGSQEVCDGVLQAIEAATSLAGVSPGQMKAGGKKDKVFKKKTQQAWVKLFGSQLVWVKNQRRLLLGLIILLLFLGIQNALSLFHLFQRIQREIQNDNPEQWLREPEILVYNHKVQNFKEIFIQSHFDPRNLSHHRLTHGYKNETRQRIYESFLKSHTKASKMRGRLEKEITLLKKIEIESLRGLYENWLLDHVNQR